MKLIEKVPKYPKVTKFSRGNTVLNNQLMLKVLM